MSAVLSSLDRLLPELEALYKDLHAHPELSMQETRTAQVAADRLRKAGFAVTTGVGKTGVVGVLENGAGPTVMLRADMDALPIEEATGLAYASKVTAKDDAGKTVPVSHMCGHDIHVTWLAGAAALLAAERGAWRGTLMVVFQPGEETAQGAQAMIDDDLFERFPKPDVVLGQHVMVGRAGDVAGSAGPITSAADSLQIRLFGRGAHGSMPQASVDPVVMAASTVLRLQTIVSREVAATEAAVVTVGVLQAGTKENVIPDDGEETEAQRVKERHGILEAVHPTPCPDRHRRGDDTARQVAPFGDAGRQKSSEADVAQDPASARRHEGHRVDPEQVESALLCGGGAAHGERERSEKIHEYEERVLHRRDAVRRRATRARQRPSLPRQSSASGGAPERNVDCGSPAVR